MVHAKQYRDFDKYKAFGHSVAVCLNALDGAIASRLTTPEDVKAWMLAQLSVRQLTTLRLLRCLHHVGCVMAASAEAK